MMLLNATCCKANARKQNVVQCLDIGLNPDHYSMHSTVNFTKAVSKFGLILMKVHRCHKTNTNSCKLAHTMRLLNFCLKMQDKFAPWYPVLQSFEPPLNSCPIQQGVYVTSSGGTSDMRFTNLLALPLLDHPWHTKVLVYNEGNEPMACVNLKVRFEYAPFGNPLSSITQ